jgi:6-phosphogluconolactonase (cycloisomerase 2 family)
MRFDTQGEKPRHMELSNDGKYLMICYQVSGEIYITPLDQDGIPMPDKATKFDFADASDIIEL